ncbi:MAG: chlorite dismutase family protein [Capsulimonadaceae bacterium]|nr:chlorite dismutase family protein [Capsulimonadaceae bacterium]
MSQPEYGTRPPDAPDKAPRQFVGFAFYKLDPSFLREHDDIARRAAVQELADVVAEARKKFMIYPFSTIGVRAEADFLLWRISYRLEDFEELAAAIRRTLIGRYLTMPHSFLSMTKTSIYVDDHVHDDQEATRNRIAVSGRKYLFVYPFVKTRAWYLLPKEERQRVMREHILLGHKYPSVKLNTTYSFGLDDQDFVVAFESDYPDDFLDLVQDLRETESSKYTQRDTPILTCIKQDFRTTLAYAAGVVLE